MTLFKRLFPAVLVAVCGCNAQAPTVPDGITYSAVRDTSSGCVVGAQRCVGPQAQSCAGGIWTNQQNCLDSNGACSVIGNSAICTFAAAQQGNTAGPSVSLSVARGDTTTAALLNPGADSSPSVMMDGNVRMWWQGSVAGVPHVLYAEASNLDGPWHASDDPQANTVNDVFQPATSSANFDASGVGSPKVLYTRNNFYMYYEGTNGAHSAIGVVTSQDGMVWTRLNNGQPIIISAAPDVAGGAKRPAVIDVFGKYYMLYSDTNGAPKGNPGVYVVRASDPEFSLDVEEFTAHGFAAAGTVPHSGYPLLTADSADWFYIDALDLFGVAAGNGNNTTLYLFDPGLMRVGTPLPLLGNGNAAPGLLTRPDRHALPGNGCSVVPFDVMRAVGPANTPANWDLAHSGADMQFTLPCANVPVARVYDNAQISTAAAGLSVVLQGQRVAFDVPAAADFITRNRYVVTPEVYSRIQQAAHVTQGLGGYGTAGFPEGLYDKVAGVFMPLGCSGISSANGSSFVDLSLADYQALKPGPALFCTP